jgi:hypothetical protein
MMDQSQRKELIATWIALQNPGEKITEKTEGFWAWEMFHEIVRGDPELGWSLISEIAAASCDDYVLANLAAGPLEDLLADHGAEFIERVEQDARRDPKFRKTHAGVWQNKMPKKIWERVRAAVT